MNELKVIEQREVLGQDFKIYGDFENPLFKADDIATYLKHSNTSKMVATVDDDEKVKATIGTLTNSYTALFLTENGLYEVLFQSRKPIAKDFKKQVKAVLKEIRQTGSYQRPMTQAEILAGQAQLLVKMEREVNETKAIAEKTRAKLDNTLNVFTAPTLKTWKQTTNAKINDMCMKYGLNYPIFRNELYKELETSAHCKLSIRQNKLRERMRMAGTTYSERQAISKIDVINKDDKLRLIFDGIIKKYQVKYLTEMS